MIAMSPSGRSWRARAVTAATIAATVACVGGPARWAVVRTFQAERGETTPAAAADAYLEAVFESGDSLEINRCLCGDARDDLFREARKLREQVESQANFGLEVESSDWHTSESEDTVSAMVNFRVTQIDPATGGVSFVEGPAQRWRFHTREEGGIGGGWKVCRIEAPPLCGAGTVNRC